MAALLEALEALSYFGAFWLFIGRPAYRAQCIASWRKASVRDRFFLLIEAFVSIVCGLGPFVLLFYLLAR